MGYVFSKDGIRPDDNKVEAINKMPQPVDKEGLQRLLGTIQYLFQYIPNDSRLIAPLRALLRNEKLWQWGPEQQEPLNQRG